MFRAEHTMLIYFIFNIFTDILCDFVLDGYVFSFQFTQYII